MTNKPVVLIADDDERLLSALTIRLEAEFEVMMAVDGHRVLELVCSRQPDLMILDVDMPGYDGFSLIELMDQIHGLKTIPVIYISGAVDEQRLRNSGQHLGAVATICKPFEMSDLTRSIRLILPEQTCAA